jgi:hypothetical protein
VEDGKQGENGQISKGRRYQKQQRIPVCLSASTFQGEIN